jgi:hypothetical protein
MSTSQDGGVNSLCCDLKGSTIANCLNPLAHHCFVVEDAAVCSLALVHFGSVPVGDAELERPVGVHTCAHVYGVRSKGTHRLMASEIFRVVAVHAGHTSGLIGIMLQLLCRLECLQDRVYEHVQLFSHCIHGWLHCRHAVAWMDSRRLGAWCLQ